MKKNKKGFTLVELLAVIVVLGIIMSIAGTAVLKQKKKANLDEARKLEKTIADLGANIYSYEYLVGVKDAKSYCEEINSNYNENEGKCENGNDDDSENYFYKSYKSLSDGSSIKISLDELKDAGYLKSDTISNPAGKGNCEGYLEVKKGPEFSGYICCNNLYETGKSEVPTSCSEIVNMVNLTNK